MNDKNEILKQALKLADSFNFYRKKSLDKKLEVVEGIFSVIGEKLTLQGKELVLWLEENKPVKSTACAKKEHETLDGDHIGVTERVCELSCDNYIITSAQNNTKVNNDFLAALKLYAEHKNAQLLISGFTYNKTGYQGDRDNNAYFAEEVKPYLVSEPLQLFKGLVFAAELDIIPTASRPTANHTGYHGDNSLIIGHSKVELASLPTEQGSNPKMIFSTGCCTLKNYRQQRAGQRAEKTHSISALIIQKDGYCSQGWQVRQLHWVDGSFIDLSVEVFKDCIKQAPPATAITFGDIHAEHADHKAIQDACDLAHFIKAKNVFLQDLWDFSSRNHHNKENHWFIAAQGQRSIKDDLTVASSVLRTISEETGAKIYVVRSNHDEALDRYLTDNAYDFRKDPINARFYLDLQSKAYGYIESGDPVPDMFKIALDVCDLGVDGVEFLTRRSVVKMQDVILSMHGDTGNNGSRATPIQLAKTYSKATTGHTHSPTIYDGIYTVGVTNTSLDMGYNTAKGGGSSWAVGHTIQYANGSRSTIIF